MAKKVERADVVLAEQGLAESREKAKRLIMAGEVYLLQGDSKTPVAKPGQQVPRDARLQIKEPERFVSRGGYKLLTALEHFAIDARGLVALDAGASTGGFTDCLLQFGAARVYAVDVGHGQLHAKLVRDPRVVNLERINLRHATPDLLPEKVDLVVADCSFISLRLILPPACSSSKTTGRSWPWSNLSSSWAPNMRSRAWCVPRNCSSKPWSRCSPLPARSSGCTPWALLRQASKAPRETRNTCSICGAERRFAKNGESG